jgi:TolB-like protein/DNA-binding winged helix-turn-helix (wHTH) protein
LNEGYSVPISLDYNSARGRVNKNRKLIRMAGDGLIMNRVLPSTPERIEVDLPFELDFQLGSAQIRPSCHEVLIGGLLQSLEPRVMQVLVALGRAAGQTVTRDELIERCWNGRCVSDDAINRTISKIRALAKLDGGASFRIETRSRLGYRLFVNEPPAPDRKIRSPLTGSTVQEPPPDCFSGHPQGHLVASAKPSIAILPFRLIGADGPYAVIAEALPHELIAELSRLRWLFVIARGSSFCFRGGDHDVRQIGEALRVRYCLSGTVEVTGGRIAITVELSDTRNREVIWADRYVSDVGGVHDIRAEILSGIVAALEIHIPLHEAQSARLKSPEHLDAWSAYHLGLDHMFRFTEADNQLATAMFELAVAKEATFARALAGLSFTHFQNAFMRYRGDGEAETTRAHQFAERAIEHDAMDPFVNLAMGRCFWLEGDVETSLGWLERATALSPNYAQGIYSQAWAHMVLCNGNEAERRVDQAISLSPLDPLHFAMLGTRAVSYLLRGEDARASAWADRAARAPGAHELIAAVAVACHSLHGDGVKAQEWANNVKRRNPQLTQRDFFQSFPFQDAITRRRIAEGLGRYGIE